jgi:hypothetical protein
MARHIEELGRCRRDRRWNPEAGNAEPSLSYQSGGLSVERVNAGHHRFGWSPGGAGATAGKETGEHQNAD